MLAIYEIGLSKEDLGADLLKEILSIVVTNFTVFKEGLKNERKRGYSHTIKNNSLSS